MNNLMLYLNFENRVYEYHLPALDNRRIQVNLGSLGVGVECMLNLEVWDGRWYAKPSPQLALRERDKEFGLYELRAERVLNGYVEETEEGFSILVAAQDGETAAYEKYFIVNSQEIHIGCNETSDICIHHAYVSREHAVIYQSNGGFYIRDSSKNGTFVNNDRLLSHRRLEFFDEIYIVGVKLIFLGDIIAINHAAQVECTLPPIHLIDIQRMLEEEPPKGVENDDYFSRAPRMMEPLAVEPIEIEGPPAAQHEKKQPLIFILGPSVTMPVPIMMSMLFNMNAGSGGNPMMYLGTLISVLSSAGIGAGWALAHQKYDKKQSQEGEKRRVEGYRKYIENNEKLLGEKHGYNRQVLEKQYLPTAELCRITGKNQMLLWNRNTNHDDFLTIRLGTGKVPFPAQIVIPRERFTLDEDELARLPFELLQRYRHMENAVATLDLRGNKLIGVIGERGLIRSAMKTMVVQTAALHCYTEVKMAFLANQSESKQMEWIRWLPHFFSGDKRVRYIAEDEGTYQNVLYALEEELRNRQEQAQEDNEKKQFLPHYLVFCTESELLEKESLYSYMVSGQNLGFTFVLLYGRMDRLPNECVRILQWDEDYQGSYLLTEVKNEVNEIVFDQITDQEADAFARSISGVYVNEVAGGEIPVSIDFMEMMQIPRLESWDLMKRYKENRVYEGIKAMVGLTYGNRPMYLDIHEKKFGPHGLVAGTTGSGKSETLMTFILSLAMNYHPSEVAFVLIDYKGGGMAAPFIGLPHLAGTITNIGNENETESIDESQTRRALVSIRSEIRRRQKIFSKYKLNHIDAYIRLYRDGQAEEPLPHLIIISDEFAELKKEQPEFIKELVSTARVGRSLGIHLILATQKPGGVVDDEIWSNSRFKICLRVQDKQDSMGMLKRPEAAYITGIGRAYLQIGNDEVFELFQSGYAGAMYEPQEEMELSQHSEVSMIDLDGSKLVSPVRRTSLGSVSQLDACVAYIAKIAQENGIETVRPLWLPPLPEKLYLDELKEVQVIGKEGIRVVVGLVDDPQLQSQYPAVLDLLDVTNIMIVGGIGKGKSTFLQTMLYGLVTAYDVGTINLYCMDFSSRTLRIFGELPHCGGVALSEDGEAVERMLKLLVDMTRQRKGLFEEAGVGSYSEYRSIAGLPLVLLVIDNYMMFKELYPELEEQVSLLLREGFKYGIQVVIAANVSGDMNYRMRQSISRIIPLYFGEKNQYTDVLGSPPEIMPASFAGRGLWEDGRVMEFQTALAVKSKNELERNREIQRRFEEISREAGSQSAAARVRTIPKDETYEEFCKKFLKTGMLPIGYNVETLEPEYVDCRRSFCYGVSFISEVSGRKFMDAMDLAANEQEITVIRVGDGRAVEPGDDEKLISFTSRLREEFIQRHGLRKEQPEGMPVEQMDIMASERFGRLVVLIDDLKEFLDGVSRAATEEEFIASIYEQVFRSGQGLGICFIAIVRPSSYHEIDGRMAGEMFLRYHTGIHFGGRLDRQKLMEFEIPLSRQMDAKEDNIGMWPDGNGCREVFMPWGPREEM